MAVISELRYVTIVLVRGRMTLSDVLVVEIKIVIGLMAAMVVYKLLTGKINIRGLLGDGKSPVTVARLQSLIGTMTVAFMYLQEFSKQPVDMPPVTTEMLAIFGGSQTLYLGGKATGLLGWFGIPGLK